jgi:heme/copper-type cytochrome/quinol oxidase subunit 1
MILMKQRKAGMLFTLVGAFLIVGGFLSYRPVSADTVELESVASWGPIILSAGLAMLAVGFIVTIFLFFTD